MNLFTYAIYVANLEKAFSDEKEKFPAKVKLISLCESQLSGFFESYFTGDSKVMSEYGPNNDLCFLYTDSHLFSVVDRCLSEVVISQPLKYRLSLITLSCFLNFLNANNWFSNEDLERFYLKYSPSKEDIFELRKKLTEKVNNYEL